MKPRAPIEGDQIPLDDPQDEMMDSPEGGLGGPPPEPEGGMAGEQEPPPMDAPMGAEGGPPPGGEGEAEEPLPAPGEEEEPQAAGGTGAITGKYNSSPVGDIKMAKAKGTYNTYKLEMSMGQLEVIRSALENNHADPVSDELLATLTYYMDKLPGPGEEEEEAEARNNPQAAALKAAGGAAGAPVAGEDTPIPMPPGQAGAGGGVNPADLDKLQEPEKPGAGAMPPGKARMLKNAPGGPGGKPKVGLPEPGEEPAPPAGADKHLPPPPRE